jgi:histidinol-phosphatase
MSDAAAYADDLALALHVADAVDAVTMHRYGAADLLVETKPDLTPVSDADHAAEELVRGLLASQRPADAVLGEEFGAAGDSARQWVIDPIDGTKNYVRGVPVWATLIALLDGGAAVVGVASAPALGRRWWAARGSGAWATAPGSPLRRLRVSGVRELADASLSHSDPTDWTDAGRGARFGALCERVWRTRGYGDFWSYMLVAEGAVDLAAEPDLSLWDVAALYPIVTEAGGRLTGLNGVDGVHESSAAASNGVLHEEFLAALAR